MTVLSVFWAPAAPPAPCHWREPLKREVTPLYACLICESPTKQMKRLAPHAALSISFSERILQQNLKSAPAIFVPSCSDKGCVLGWGCFILSALMLLSLL